MPGPETVVDQFQSHSRAQSKGKKATHLSSRLALVVVLSLGLLASCSLGEFGYLPLEETGNGADASTEIDGGQTSSNKPDASSQTEVDAGIPDAPDASVDAGQEPIVLPSTDAGVRAFPSAEGWAADIRGGRGGKVLHVTNLNDDGAGSFRWAMTQPYPRIVVFDVSGTIVLNTGISLKTNQGRLTVAGQTSPGGIQIKGLQDATKPFEGIVVQSGADDVVIRFLRIRAGRPNGNHIDGGLGVWGNQGRVGKVIFDHNSLEWATHTALWRWGDTSQVTFSWNLVAASNGAGLDVGCNGSAHHNMVVHSFYGISGRGWKAQSCESEWRNNIVYNTYYAQGSWGDYVYNLTTTANIINNWFIAGSLKHTDNYFRFQNGGPTRPDGVAASFGGTKLYFSGNWGPRCPAGCADEWDHQPVKGDSMPNPEFPTAPATASQFRVTTPFALAGVKIPVTTFATSELEIKLPPTIGAYKPSRDSVDTLFIEDFKKRRPMTSSALQGNGGPWPDLATGAPKAPLDTDQDGMPDVWETAHGLNPQSSADGPMTATNGYTHVENYLNELAGDLVP